MYHYILESKDTVRHIVADRAVILKNALEYVLRAEPAIEQIYLVGSGTSYHAALAAKPLMERVLGIKVFTSYPLQFRDGERVFNKNTLVIGGSHAGKSSSTINALDKARDLGLKTIASTATPGSELERHGDVTLYCDIGVENAGPKTKGYIGAIATYVAFALEWGVAQGKIAATDAASYFARLQKTTDNIPAIAEAASTWYAANAAELKTARRMVVLGYEQNIPTYLEGTLKILEAVRYGVTGYEMEEFMHGIYHSIGDDTFMIYIGAPGQYFERMLRLEKYFQERTAHNFIITGKSAITSDNAFAAGKHFVADFVDDPDFNCLEYIVPLQVLARRLSADLGIDCNVPSDPDFHRKMGSYRF
jgi:glucosamine 6-phosphate synthetase-like amidotransferase/phosphosugar isomerase protein